MSVFLFAGPTLSPADQASSLEAVWLPPARQGDIYRVASLLKPRAIGLIDGYFRSAPAVWHKEILWAMKQGVHVFGSGSMGALRAAELAPFGMQGVGIVFNAYRRGILPPYADEPFEDDDEVALVHGPADSGYLPASEPMVNIRCTLAAAERAGVMESDERTVLAAIAKALHFPLRSYESMLERARGKVRTSQLDSLRAWLPSGRVDQKRNDAIAMLDVMASFLAQDPGRARPRFDFEHTVFWERASQRIDDSPHEPDERNVLSELRLDLTAWARLHREVVGALASPAMTQSTSPPWTAAACNKRVAPHELELALAAAERRRRTHQLMRELPVTLIERQMLARLRASGEFERLRLRFEDKCAELASRSDLPDPAQFSEPKLLEMRDWYFCKLSGGQMPDDLDLFVFELGYTDLVQFHRAVFNEFVYRQMTLPGNCNPGRTEGGVP